MRDQIRRSHHPVFPRLALAPETTQTRGMPASFLDNAAAVEDAAVSLARGAATQGHSHSTL